jgi:hypothetical protein
MILTIPDYGHGEMEIQFFKKMKPFSFIVYKPLQKEK